jgi:glutamine synthetase
VTALAEPTRREAAVETLSRLDELGADALWVVYHDLSGIGRAKAVPAGRFADVAANGVTFAMANWDIAITDHQVPDPIFGADSGDFRALPDPATIVPIPHRSGVAQAFPWLLDDVGRAWPGDPRSLLARQVDRLADHGLVATVAFEAEFVLVAERPEDLLDDNSRMFTVDALDARWDLGRRLFEELATTGIAVHQLGKEYGPGQFELSLMPAGPLPAADRFLLARQLIKALAREQGLAASFMPKPFADLPGNGLHVHIGLVPAAAPTSDALAVPADDTSLTATGRAAVAGLLEHAAAQTALGAPTPNSYKRLLPGSWAPAHVSWATGNRAALVRIPGRGAARHIEYRAGDASMNPYLHLAGLLAAIADGLDRGLEPVAAATVDIGHLSDGDAAAAGHPRLPDRLSTALAALEADDVILDALGPILPAHFLALKRFELQSFIAETGSEETSTEVTEWERTTYFEPL